MDVVQLRFMQFHSLTSLQHMTIRWSSNQASVLGTVHSVKGLIHLLGDSGSEIGSRLTTVDSGDGEVRLSELWNCSGLKVLCRMTDIVKNIKLSTLSMHIQPVVCECFPDSVGCESSRECRARSTGKRTASCQRFWSGHKIVVCLQVRVYRHDRTYLLLVTYSVFCARVCVCYMCCCLCLVWFGLFCFVV